VADDPEAKELTMTTNLAREEILAKVRLALGRPAGGPVGPVPASARLEARSAGEPSREMELLLSEIGKLGGMARRLPSASAIPAALRELVEAESIKKAMVWETPELQALGVADCLRELGVELVPAHAPVAKLAECDLGVTGVDAALPETGTLLLRSAPDKPRLVSLLPRVHVAIVSPAALRADLTQAFGDIQGGGYGVAITRSEEHTSELQSP
jgi:L-lactate utilization protein LutC